jgi:putative intracellular protease/amidase
MSQNNAQHPESSAMIGLKDLGTVHRLGVGALRKVGDAVWGDRRTHRRGRRRTPKEKGAIVDNSAPWTSHVVRDRNLIGGQNPHYSEDVAKAALTALAE